MFSNTLLIAGWFFVMVMSIGQLLIQRQNSANRILFSLFVVCCLWVSHAILFRTGMVHQFAHLNKVYLPLLCVTGPLWYCYVRSLYEASSTDGFDKRFLRVPAVCFLLSIPFYLQSATYKQTYIEVNITDFVSLTMYTATRLAELTLLWYFTLSLWFLQAQIKLGGASRNTTTAKLLWILTSIALLASIIRLIGSVLGNHTISVLIPTALSLGVIICMHLLSYRLPVVLALDSRGARQIKSPPDGSAALNDYIQQIHSNEWFLDPDLKIVGLARKLGVPANDLSVAINHGTGKNYNEFINNFRVEYAKKMLLKDPAMSVLDVAFASGFNSKSVFYQNFTSVTGTTPAKFRKSPSPERVSVQTVTQK